MILFIYSLCFRNINYVTDFYFVLFGVDLLREEQFLGVKQRGSDNENTDMLLIVIIKALSQLRLSA